MEIGGEGSHVARDQWSACYRNVAWACIDALPSKKCVGAAWRQVDYSRHLAAFALAIAYPHLDDFCDDYTPQIEAFCREQTKHHKVVG